MLSRRKLARRNDQKERLSLSTFPHSICWMIHKVYNILWKIMWTSALSRCWPFVFNSRVLWKTFPQAVWQGGSMGSAPDEAQPRYPYYWCPPVDAVGPIPILDQISSTVAARRYNGIGQCSSSYTCSSSTGCVGACVESNCKQLCHWSCIQWSHGCWVSHNGHHLKKLWRLFPEMDS